MGLTNLKWRTLAFRTLAICIGLGVGLVLAEIVLRIAHLAPSAGLATVSEKQFAQVPGLLAPNQQLTDVRVRALPHHIRTDSLGYRGDDFPRAKPAGEFRVLMVGDSFTYGDFVSDNETLPAQLGARLTQVCRLPRVINAGIGGTTILEARHMVERAMPLEPDLVILTFTENDVTDLAGTSLWDELAANRRAKSRFPLSVAYPIMRNSAIWGMALSVRGKLRARKAEAVAPQPMVRNADSSLATLRADYERRFLALRDTLAVEGIPLVMAIYPSHHAVLQEAQRGQIEWIEKVAAAASVPTLSFLPSLVASKREMTDIYLLPHDGHASARGDSIAADTLTAFLTQLPAVRTGCLR
jgi:lysophospholipase L1-like esterase